MSNRCQILLANHFGHRPHEEVRCDQVDQVENLGFVTWFRSNNRSIPQAEVYAPNIVMHIALKLLDTYLWILDRRFSGHMTLDKSLLRPQKKLQRTPSHCLQKKILAWKLCANFSKTLSCVGSSTKPKPIITFVYGGSISCPFECLILFDYLLISKTWLFIMIWANLGSKHARFTFFSSNAHRLPL